MRPFGEKFTSIPKKYHIVPKSFVSKLEAKLDFNTTIPSISSLVIIILLTYRERKIQPIKVHFRKIAGS